MGVSKKYKISFLAIALLYFTVHGLNAQGLPRKMGVGVRAGLWKPSNVTDEYDLDFIAISVSDDVGRGGVVYAFTRLVNNWYVESTFGSDGGTNFSVLDAGGDKEGSARITSLLLGCRYDWLPEKFSSIFQPYFSAGMGMYWVSQDMTSAVVGPVTVRIKEETWLKGGGYACAGMHIVVKDWFALNVDAKYHFISFRPSRGYSGFEVGGGICLLSGRKKELFRVEDIKVIVSDVYPAYYHFYSSYPLALVTVKNAADYPVEINVISEIPGYSERSQESGYIRLGPKERKDIPVYVLFGKTLLNTYDREPAVLDMVFEARTGPQHRQTLSTNLVIHGRNAWDGAIEKLEFFVTPDDMEILRMGRRAAEEVSDLEDGLSQSFILGMRLFEDMGSLGLRYQSDPDIPFYRDDRVQFASETLELKTGDCDDLVVLLASLMLSVGIRTAFVDVQNTEKIVAHVFLMFDTGLQPEDGHLISTNEKRYVVREDDTGRRTIWIPVETTLVEKGFEEAWRVGATQYVEEGILRNGLSEGWVSIIDSF